MSICAHRQCAQGPQDGEPFHAASTTSVAGSLSMRLRANENRALPRSVTVRENEPTAGPKLRRKLNEDDLLGISRTRDGERQLCIRTAKVHDLQSGGRICQATMPQHGPLPGLHERG